MSAPSTTGRLLGVDAARGLAVLGMCLVHVHPTTGPTWLLDLAQGRSAALFAVLAGVSLALLSGGTHPPADLTTTRRRIGVRAAILLVLGLTLATLGTSVMVILCYYALYFLLCLPLLRLQAPALAALAAATAVAGPVASFAIRSHMEINEFGGSPSWLSVGDAGGALTMLLLTGAYPALTWTPFVLAGMALGRRGAGTTPPIRLVTAGAALVAAGFGGSWFVQTVLGGRERLVAVLEPILAGSGLSAEQILSAPSFGTATTTSWWNLTLANAHSGTPFEIIGSIGVALVVLGGLTALSERRWGRLALRPLIATGTMALTVYCLHIVILAVLPPVRFEGEEAITLGGMSLWTYFVLLIAALVVFALAWTRRMRRGPLETLVHRATLLIRPRPSTPAGDGDAAPTVRRAGAGGP
ncbi:hypothetical protein TPB0596_06530 [Tsukamurella pulmonis]|uniref:DUF418 domain-containing protein n=1 Tax=Tsukamurella pulmonis TaxID=47312 RepID=UPI001EDD9EFC|nr:DUF418 domain-containing protein [Tsukamurella pulmonis]BDD80890.1 hypothetical protein TPB0596_06530 [Tsukamurella pulmonis]